jgi:hypothetical protein
VTSSLHYFVWAKNFGDKFPSTVVNAVTKFGLTP